MKIVCLALVACLASVAMANTMYLVADETSLRMVNNITGMASTAAVDKPFPARALAAVNPTALPSVYSPVWNSVTGKVYALQHLSTAAPASANGAGVVAIDATTTPWSVQVLAGAATSAGAAGSADGSGTSASFTSPRALAVMANGDIMVADGGDAAGASIRRVTPAGAVSQYAGLTGTAATAGGLTAGDNGIGTNAKFTAIHSMVAQKDGTLYVSEDRRIRKVAPDAAVTFFAGTGALGFADGVGTAATVGSVNHLVLNKDETAMWMISSTANPASADLGPLPNTDTYVIRKVTLASGVVATLAGNSAAAAATADADGVGTNAVISGVTGAIMDAAGNIVFTAAGANGGVVRKYSPMTNTVTTLSSSQILAATQATVVPGSGTAVTRADGAADVATFVAPFGLVAVQQVCNKLVGEGATVKIDASCTNLAGTIAALDVTSTVSTTQALTVAGDAMIGSNGKATFGGPTTIAGALVLTSNGTIVVNGAPVTANTLTMSSAATYQVLINKLVPEILAITNAANLDGNIVLAIDSAYDFGIGASAIVMTFGNRVGQFAAKFFVKLRTPLRSNRALLQAPNADLNCGATNCRATGVDLSRDDDDEVPFLVALIIVSIALLILICAAIFFFAASRSREGKRAAAVPVGDDFDYSSSSSYGVAADFFGPDYTYSYSY